MENKEPRMWPDYGGPDYNKDDSDSNGCVAMLCTFAVVAVVAIAWPFTNS